MIEATLYKEIYLPPNELEVPYSTKSITTNIQFSLQVIRYHYECALTLEKLDVCFKCRHEVFDLVWLEGPPLLSLLQCWDHDFTEVLLDHLQHTTAITGVQHTTVQLLHGGDRHTLTTADIAGEPGL